ncbi:hypothetical protein ACFU3E_17130 [Streptomyces sp. NPDC057424]|uniref:hypothetical protein n=1 Tax=Streptomyces sp. NPDC057424 TaxID=3346127 RepID=UPI00368EA4B3
MSDRPYTDADLRAEAARQHATASEDPDFMGVGEQMEYTFIDSTIVDPDPATGTEPITGNTWDALAPHDFEAAQRDIHRLINGAADVSEWAVNLGADGLEPDEHQLTWSAGEQPIVRVHFAFHPRMHAEARDYLVTAVGEAMHDEMQRAVTPATTTNGEPATP